MSWVTYCKVCKKLPNMPSDCKPWNCYNCKEEKE